MRRDVVVQILGFVFVVVIVIIFFWFLFNTRPSNSTNETQNTEQKTDKSLQEYAGTNTAVTFTSDGIINGQDEHRQIRITVNNTARTLEIVQGYQNTVINTYSFANNQEAYKQFLAALNTSGYAKEKVDAKVKNPEGQCPLGIRYYYDASNVENFPDNLWSSSCGKQIGTFGGNFSDVRSLFQLQIPSYNTLTQNVSLN